MSSKLQYSGFRPDTLLGDGDMIRKVNYYNIGRYDGNPVTGIMEHNGSFFVLKKRSMYYLTGDFDSASLDPFDKRVGCVAPQSLIQFYGGWLFLSYEGWMFLYGDQLINLSRKFLRTTMPDINWDYAHLSSSAIMPKYNEVWLSIPTGSNTEPDTTLVLNYGLSQMDNQAGRKTFYKFSLDRAAMETIIDSNGDETVWSADNSGNLLAEDSGTSDIDSDGNASAIASYFETADLNHGFAYHKKWNGLLVDFLQTGSYNLTVGRKVDGAATYTDQTVSLAGDKRDFDYVEHDSIAEGNKIRYKLSNSTINQTWRVFGLISYWKKHKIRRT